MNVRVVVLTVALTAALAACAPDDGAPSMRLPLTWSQDDISITLDEENRASVTDIPHEDTTCTSVVAGGTEVTGSGEWSWEGSGRLVVSIDGVEIAVQSASYLGEADWTRLLVDRCGTDFNDDAPVELFLEGALSAVEG
jgi:hypothetical protein